jgi:hypothetical protein
MPSHEPAKHLTNAYLALSRAGSDVKLDRIVDQEFLVVCGVAYPEHLPQPTWLVG